MLCYCATVLPLYVWGERHGGSRGRLLSVSVFLATDFCGEVRGGEGGLRGGDVVPLHLACCSSTECALLQYAFT